MMIMMIMMIDDRHENVLFFVFRIWYLGFQSLSSETWEIHSLSLSWFRVGFFS